MPRTRNRPTKEFVSKDKENEDEISRVLGPGTRHLKKLETNLVRSKHAVTLCEIST